MKGNFHVQFLGEGVAATSPPYPTLGWATTQVYPARISLQQSLAQTALLARATNLRIKANRVPPRGFVQKPVPERPRRLAVKPWSAPALRVQSSSLSRRQSREDRSVAGYRRDLKRGSGNIHESTRAAREFPKDGAHGAEKLQR